MATTLTIDGTAYSASQRAAAGISLNELSLSWENPDELSFMVFGCGPEPDFTTGMEVVLTVDGDVKFIGDLDIQGQNPTEAGWVFSYRAYGLKARADRVTITGPDGTGEATYNRSPTDLLYVASEAGRTVGEIIELLLTVQDNANRLAALGIGNYVSLSPPTLPTATLTDLAALDVVPPYPVTFSGIGILNHLEQELLHWHPKYGVRIEPDGTIRFRNLFGLTRHELVAPTEFDDGDPIDPPRLTRTTAGCYTAWKYIGVNVQPAILSVVDGTLDANWTSTQQSNWKYSDFGQPGDAVDVGTITALTSTSATLDPDLGTRAYVANTLSDRQAVIFLINPVATGLDIQEFRAITANTTLTAGGTFVVNWSSGHPLDATGYTKYRIVMQAGGLIDVWRSYVVREPATGNEGLSTFVGSRLMPRFPKPIPWANNGKVETISTAVAKVLWSSNGNPPYFEWPMTVEIDRSIGGVRFAEPAVKVTTPGGLAYLKTTGSPPNFAAGLPADIQVVVPYNRGGLEARKPASGYEGTAYTEDGIERVMEVHLDDWTFFGDKPDIEKLAQEHLDTVKDATITGLVGHHGLPSTWDVFTLDYALDLVIPGAGASELLRHDNLPVRTVTISWDTPTDLHYVTFEVSNLKRPFQGDDLYTHPAFGGSAAVEMGSGFDEWNTAVYDSAPRMQAPGSAASNLAAMTPQSMWMAQDPTSGLPTSPPATPAKTSARPTPPMGDLARGGFDSFSAVAAASPPDPPAVAAGPPMGDLTRGGFGNFTAVGEAAAPAPPPPPPAVVQNEDTLRKRRGL